MSSLLVWSIIALVMFFSLWIISDGNMWFAVAVIAIMALLVPDAWIEAISVRIVAYVLWWRGSGLG